MVSAFTNFFRRRYARSAQRVRARRVMDRALFSRQALRTQWYRRIMAVVLVALGFIALVEIVIMPGRLVRGAPPTQMSPLSPLSPGAQATAGGSEPDATPADDTGFRLPFGIQTDEQKAKQKQEQLDRVERRLRSTHEKLDQSYQQLIAARDEFESHCREKLHVFPDAGATPPVPESLVDVVAHEPTAQIAWAKLLAVPQQADRQSREAREMLNAVAVHFTNGLFLTEDDRDMRASLDGLNRTLSALIESRECVDHIATLQRARAALAHQPPLEDNPRTPP